MPAFRWLIWEVGFIFIYFNASTIARFDMDGQTLDITMRLAWLTNLRICIKWSFILIYCVCSIRLSKTCLLDKNIQKRWFEMRDTNIMLVGFTILPMAIIYSIWGIPSIELNTIACSLLGVFSVAVALAKFMLVFVLVEDGLIDCLIIDG